MKKVILLRHAKSSWADPNLEDHDRPLNSRGKAAAPIIAKWLAHSHHLPDFILCSSSKRTRQTVKRMRDTLPDLPNPKIEPDLYHAPPETMRQHLAKLPESYQSAMLVGHQPGLGAFARKLSNHNVRRRCARAFEHFPTAAAAVLELDLKTWANIEEHTGEFIDFGIPRELEKSFFS
ncbi:MAG: histidine phosphatase family protein [Pseudomonadota bacterium]